MGVDGFQQYFDRILSEANYVKERLNYQWAARIPSSIIGGVNRITVTEYPRSGGSWLADMISEIAGFERPHKYSMTTPSSSDYVIHGHFWYRMGLSNIVCVWRDGRDVAVSNYYHCLLINDKNNRRRVEHFQRHLNIPDPDNIEKNFSKFLSYYLSTPRRPRFTWGEYVNQWHRSDLAKHVRYEEIYRNGVEVLCDLLPTLGLAEIPRERVERIVYRYESKRQAAQKKNNSSAHVRRAIIGEWQQVFTSEDEALFMAKFGNEMAKLGYKQQ